MQRRAQRDLEDVHADVDDEDDEFGAAPLLGAPQFCQLCRLNYRTDPEEHKLSREHRQMKRLLKPSCRTCQVGFTTAMEYEIHRASIDHLQAEAAAAQGADSKRRTDSVNVNWGEFQTVDSIGDVDEADALLLEKNEAVGVDFDESATTAVETTGEPIATEEATTPTNESTSEKQVDKLDETSSNAKATANIVSPKKKTTKAAVVKTSSSIEPSIEPPNIGVEVIREIKVMYCDVCRTTLTQRTDPEITLRNHCRWRTHIKLYNQHLDAVARREARKRKQQQLDKVAADRKRKAESSRAAKVTAKAASLTNISKDNDSNDVSANSTVNESNADITVEVTTAQDDAAGAAAATTAGGAANEDDVTVLKDDDDEDDDIVDDKIWADVDKDLGDLLQAVSSENANDDEDEDSTTNTERYLNCHYS